MKKLAIIRTDHSHQCPFGLPIDVSCRNVGDAIYDMEPLENVPEEQRERYKKSNRRVYRHSAKGERCPMADKLISNRGAVVCDWGEPGQGEHSAPFRGSTYYPRVFGNFGQSSLISAYPIGTYSDNFPGQIFDGVFQSTYASAPREFIVEGTEFFEIEGVLETTAAAPIIDLKLPDGFKTDRERYEVYVRQSADDSKSGKPPPPEETHQTHSLPEAQTWALSRVGPGKVVDLEVQLDDQQFALNRLDELATDKPDRVKQISLSELDALEPEAVNRQLIAQDVARSGDPIYLCTYKSSYQRFTSIDGDDFKPTYRKISLQRRIVWQRLQTGAHEYRRRIQHLNLPDEILDLYTADSDPTHKNPT